MDAIVRGTQVNVDDTLVGGWMRKESSEQALYVFFLIFHTVFLLFYPISTFKGDKK